MNQFTIIFVGAILIESITGILKSAFDGGKFSKTIALSIVLGIAFAVAFNLDLFTLVGLESNIPYLAQALSGIILSRGANYIADLLNKFGLENNKNGGE